MKQIAVCIVEDMADIRTGLEKIIDTDPDLLLMASCSSAEEALEKLPELQPDIVIMDINLPGMDGIECIRKIAPACTSTQFMMFTIYENSEQVFEALEAGASGYLLKNTTADTMLSSLKELYGGGSPMSAHIARKVVGSFKKTPALPDASPLLSARESQVLEWLAKGYLYKEIAGKLSITIGTVRQHIHHIYKKLHVQNRTEALNKVYGKQGTNPAI